MVDLLPDGVPRPDSARPGAPAPWAGLPDDARRGIALPRVAAALVGAGQGGEPPEVGSVQPFVETLDHDAPPEEHTGAGGVVRVRPGAGREAAVLVALFEEAGETRVVLTRRSSELRAHRGEVAFPGGRVDPGESLVTAALREAEEEVGLDRAHASLVGWLRPLMTFLTGTVVNPVVASLPARPSLAPSPGEVARVFDVALADLLADGVFHEERWTLPGRPVPAAADGSFPVWFFAAAGETIWGATARVLHDLLCLVVEVGPGHGGASGAR